MKINKKLFALLISIILILSSLPVSAFAQGEEGLTETSDLSNAELALIYDEKNYENEYVPGELIVGLNESNEVEVDTLEEDVDANIEIAEVKEIETYGVEPVRDTLVITLEDKSEEAVLDAIEELKNDPSIAYVEPNYKKIFEAVPNDEYYAALWGMEKINAPSAWDITTGDSSVMVALIDTGVDYTHEDLADNVEESLGYNLADNSTDVMDVYGHGTRVAGVIGASANNEIGVVGVNWDVTIVPVRIADSNGDAEDAYVIAAIYYAASLGAPIINASYTNEIYIQAEKDAIDAYDGLVVAAAGNKAFNLDTTPRYPAAYDCDNIISVAATDREDSLAEFSNYGTVSVDIAAPGVDILTTAIYEGNPNTYAFCAGTSYSAPHVAGAAALLLSNYKDLTTAELKEAILESVDKVPDLNEKCVTGGRLNVANALEYAEVFHSDDSPDKNDNKIPDKDEHYVITEKFEDRDGNSLPNVSDTTVSVDGAVEYFGVIPSIPGYKYVGCYFKANHMSHEGGSLTNLLTGEPYILLNSITGEGTYVNHMVFEYDDDQYGSVNYDKNASDATGTMAEQKDLLGNEITLSANQFTRPGYLFAGWSTSPTGDVVAYADTAKFMLTQKTTTLYAIWKYDPNQWATISYNKNADKATGRMDSVTVLKNVAMTLSPNRFALDGHLYLGWSTKSSGAAEYANQGTMIPTGDMTLYAVWGTADMEISFDSDSKSANVGDTIGYTFTAINKNTVNSLPLYNTVITIKFNDCISYIDGSSVVKLNGQTVQAASYDAATNELRLNPGTINPGDVYELTFDGIILAQGEGEKVVLYYKVYGELSLTRMFRSGASQPDNSIRVGGSSDVVSIVPAE